MRLLFSTIGAASFSKWPSASGTRAVRDSIITLALLLGADFATAAVAIFDVSDAVADCSEHLILIITMLFS